MAFKTTNVRGNIPLRYIFNAIFYLIKTGCQWRIIPGCFPNWELVYYYFARWKNNGVIEQVHELLHGKIRKTKLGNVNLPVWPVLIVSLLKQPDWAANVGVLMVAK